MDISALAITQATGTTATLHDLQMANCIVTGTDGHELCGWCPNCNQPVYHCLHERPMNPLLEELSNIRVLVIVAGRDRLIENFYKDLKIARDPGAIPF